MKINHTVTQYAIGLGALALAANATVSTPPAIVHDAAVHQIQKPSKFDWASLGQQKTTALGDALKGARPGKVTIFCQNATCHDLQLDFDDAFQAADWKENLEMLPVESEEDKGIFVGPPGIEAENLASAILTTTGLEATIVPIDTINEQGKPIPIDGLGVIIGKVSR